jgi:hypothetical protein
MTASVQLDRLGPDWPIGLIKVTTPGTPVSIMSLVDPNGYNDPSTATLPQSNEYTPAAQQIFFSGYKAGASHGMVQNTGNVYIVRKGVGSGTGNRDDTGSIVHVLAPGETWYLASAATNLDVFSPYRYYLDADVAGEGALVTLLVQ